jgi:hypothetical protein
MFCLLLLLLLPLCGNEFYVSLALLLYEGVVMLPQCQFPSHRDAARRRAYVVLSFGSRQSCFHALVF